jgi:putative phosphoserine phosphatase/1-acylglycerol-3-phosphate O-acyltransferase
MSGGKERKASTPGTVAEVDNSTDGPGNGAFFDLDGTLIAGFSAKVFLQDRLRNRDIGGGEVLRTLGLGLQGATGKAGFEELMEVSSKSLRGRRHEDLVATGDRLFKKRIAALVYPEMQRLVQAHQRRGHTVVLCSSATSYQVEPVASALGIEHVVCNRMVVDDEGKLTGDLVQPVIWGEGKARAAQELAEKLSVDLAQSWFYADGDEDVALMHLVGRPRPVNPRSRLEAVAKRRGWPILRVSGRGSTGAVGLARNAVGIASAVPAAALGIAVGAARRDKRAGLNVGLPAWIAALFAVNGVKLRVVEGEEHLKAPRPAVFIFNHKNNFDSFLAASLVRTNWTGVAKKELERDPMFRTLGRWMDAVFVDRSDSAVAVEQMKAMEGLARKGLSVMVAPEGTRSFNGELLPFKKGAFRVAMATGLPLIPIVFRNSEVLGHRDANTMRPGSVEAAVLPPIDVSDWTVENLAAHIEDVRRMYLDTLEDWPDAPS